MDKTAAIGIMADGSFPAKLNRVDGADEPGLAAQPRHILDDGLLVRNGHVEPLTAQCPKTGEGRSQLLGTHIKGEVTPVHSHFSEGRIVHRRRKGVGDRMADDSRQPGLSCDLHSESILPFKLIPHSMIEYRGRCNVTPR